MHSSPLLRGLALARVETPACAAPSGPTGPTLVSAARERSWTSMTERAPTLHRANRCLIWLLMFPFQRPIPHSSLGASLNVQLANPSFLDLKQTCVPASTALTNPPCARGRLVAKVGGTEGRHLHTEASRSVGASYLRDFPHIPRLFFGPDRTFLDASRLHHKAEPY